MKYIPVNEPVLRGNEKKYLNECIDTGWISSDGPFVKTFEDKFSFYNNRKHGIAVANGSVAIDVALTALDIKKGDEVILPAFTIISCINPIIRLGAVPVLVDAEKDTWNMNVNEIESKISSKTKAIMMVHIYGHPVDVDPILELCKKYNLFLIEDAAEVIGQEYKGRKCGSFGDISTFSFYPNKHITTGEGGMVLTNSDELDEKCRSLRNLCFKPERRFIHEEIGWNFRMTNLQAAIGLAQLEQIDQFLIKKRQIGKWYNELLFDIDIIDKPLPKTTFSDNIYWVYGIVLDANLGKNAIDLMTALNTKGIGTRPFFYGLNRQPVFKKMGLFVNEKFEVADYLSDYGFYLPSGLNLEKQDVEIVCEKLKEEIFK
jgi:perosamine synthetase